MLSLQGDGGNHMKTIPFFAIQLDTGTRQPPAVAMGRPSSKKSAKKSAAKKSSRKKR
jgi:hypothetical protein